MRKQIVMIFLLTGIVVSCDHIYKEYDKESFTTLSWKKGDQIIFNPVVKDISKRYALVLGLRHMYGADIRRMDVVVKIVSPSGQALEKSYFMDVMDDEGEYLASCAGNLCDIETVVDENITFSEPGKYQVIITQDAEQTVRGIMEFGMIIRESDGEQE